MAGEGDGVVERLVQHDRGNGNFHFIAYLAVCDVNRSDLLNRSHELVEVEILVRTGVFEVAYNRHFRIFDRLLEITHSIVSDTDRTRPLL